MCLQVGLDYKGKRAIIIKTEGKVCIGFELDGGIVLVFISCLEGIDDSNI